MKQFYFAPLEGITTYIYRNLHHQKFDGMECCECGCCSYICPAKRPLTQMIKSMRKMVLASRKKK